MGEGISYVLDTNIYVQAHQHYYAFGLVDSFWQHLIAHADTGQIVSIDRVHNELMFYKDDPLAIWARDKCSIAFEKTDGPFVVHYYQQIMKWVQGHNFKPSAKVEFADSTDAWVVAYAKATSRTICTLETYEEFRINKVKIPNVAKQFGVRCIDTFGMLQELKLKLG